jgi:hypothetical protein
VKGSEDFLPKKCLNVSLKERVYWGGPSKRWRMISYGNIQNDPTLHTSRIKKKRKDGIEETL